MMRPFLLESSNRIIRSSTGTRTRSISIRSHRWRTSIVSVNCIPSGSDHKRHLHQLPHERQLRQVQKSQRLPAVISLKTTTYPSLKVNNNDGGVQSSVVTAAYQWSTRLPKREFSTTQVEKKTTIVEPMLSRRVYRYLQLGTFTHDEIHDRFNKISKYHHHHQQIPSSPAIADVKITNHKDDENDATSTSTTATANANDFIDSTQVRKYIEQRILLLEKDSQDYYVNRTYDSNEEDRTDQLRQDYISTETDKFLRFFIPGGNNNEIAATCMEDKDVASSSNDVMRITKDQFTMKIIESASSVDFKRSWPITVSMLLIGSSVGVVTPVMPFVVQNLGLTAGEYGLVVSAFALAKMSGNIPSAVLVERHGRKPYLVYTMLVVAFGVGGIGFATSFEHLYLCRLLTGLGVAGISTAATLTLTDISTPLNRASTIAPIMSAFAAGTALGPALGGILCDQIGVTPTFYIVGVSYFGLAAVNWALLEETMTSNRPIKFPWQVKSKLPTRQQETIQESFKKAVGQWIPLLSDPLVRNVCVMNAFYWVALAGSQMTLLPLILTDPNGLAMSATNVGQVYMGMSLIQVMGNPIFAKVVDKVGKTPGIVSGCTLISTAMASLPFCADVYQMAGVFAVWATGSSLLSTSPLAYISDTVDEKRRAQAIALLRTSGDVGFLVGASSMGALADWAGSLDTALQSSAGILLTATGWFATRQLLTSRLSKTL